MTTATKQDQLDDIAQQIVDDKICPELAASATQLVMGDGNPDAELVFIGEAPGKNEDLQGKPFVGASGKSLAEMLDTIGLKREDVYITNIVKYRPPENRDPRSSEKEAFIPILLRQLEIIQPKLVVTLGRHSMEYFMPNQKITEVHGKIRTIELAGISYTILPLFHPSGEMSSKVRRQALVDDFASIPNILQKLNNS